jgi:hypothetical protein
MPNDAYSMASLVESFYREAYDDAIGLWEVETKVESRVSAGETVRQKTLAIVRLMLERGLYAGDLAKDGSFVPWPQQHPGLVIDRIRREWTELGHDPGIGDIVWFGLPSPRAS